MASEEGNNSEASNVKSTFCATIVEPVRFRQQWKIENFYSLMKYAKCGDVVRSVPFGGDHWPDCYWQVCIYPAGKRDINANHLSIFVKMSAAPHIQEVRVRAEYGLYFVKEDNTTAFKNVHVGIFHAKPPKGGHSWGLRNVPTHIVINSLHSDGSLIVCCGIEMVPTIDDLNCLPVPIPRYLASITKGQTEFASECLAAFEGGEMADTVIECDGESIPVNKFVLCAHSMVFKAMFSHRNVRECRDNKIVVVDTDIQSFKTMVRFMYSGEVDSKENIPGALALAERYGVEPLKKFCEMFLCERVTKDNVVAMISLADLYNCNLLKDATFNCLVMYRNSVLNSDEWRMLKEANAPLATEILERLALSPFGIHTRFRGIPHGESIASPSTPHTFSF